MKNKKGFFLIVFLICCVQKYAIAQGVVSDAVEKQALLNFHSAMDGDDWATHWSTSNLAKLGDSTTPLSDITGLTGIVISNGDVTEISFYANSLSGTLPSTINNLVKLQKLKINCDPKVWNNKVEGTLPSLSLLTELREIDLANNDCTGTVDWLGNMPLLQSVNLRGDGSSSTASRWLTITLLPNVSSLTSMTFLDLGNNKINSQSTTNYIPAQVGSWDNLVTLKLVNCSLRYTSFATEFGGMLNLKTLDLSGNFLLSNGEVTSAICTLSNLETLYLNEVALTKLPSSFNLLDNLKSLYLERNGLNNTGTKGTQLHDYIIGRINGCSSLNFLSLRENSLADLSANFVASTIPLRTLDISLNPITATGMYIASSQITTLIMEACGQTTSLPQNIRNIPNLIKLDLGNWNEKISADLSNNPLRNLLDLTQTNVSNVLSFLPSSIRILTIDYRAISGTTLPDWFGIGLANLDSLRLQANRLVNLHTSSSLNFVGMDALKSLDLGGNCFQPSFPSYINCTELPSLRIFLGSYNASANSPFTKLSEFPDFGACSNIAKISLNNNNISVIPPYLSSSTTLNTLDISENSISQLVDLTGLTNLYLKAENNFLDFEDLNGLLANPPGCTRKIAGVDYEPQKAQDPKGVAQTINALERSDVLLTFSAPPGTNNIYKWEFNNLCVAAFPSTIDGCGPAQSASGDKYTVSNLDPSKAGVYTTRIRNNCFPGEYGNFQFQGAPITVNMIPPLCESSIPIVAGTFKLDKLTGNIVFVRDGCDIKMPITCVFGPSGSIDNVVSASAIHHADNWSQSYLNPTTYITPDNKYTTGESGKWRQKASYVYNTPIDQTKDKNYNSGTFKYKMFNHQDADRNATAWVKTSQIDKYSPHGDPVEERNALSVPSTAKFGYNNALPVLVAQNAEYSSVMFESFERVYGSAFEDNAFVNSDMFQDAQVAHAGKNSLKLVGSQSVTIKTFFMNNQIKTNGLFVRLWVRGVIDNDLKVVVTKSQFTLPPPKAFHKITSSGEWTLYEVELVTEIAAIPLHSATADGSFQVSIQYLGNGTVNLDDVRVQPNDAEMTAYVYDPATLKLLTVFDDQNFGLYYQYNSEGKLVRKMIETEKGIFTLQETQYNIRKVNK